MNIYSSNKIKIVVWGASGHAAVIANVLGFIENFEVVGFMDSINPDRKGELFCGKKILGGKEQLPYLKEQQIKHIALGFGKCMERIELGDLLTKEGFILMNLYHPNATIAKNAEIGIGTAVLAGAVIDPYCQIGDYCIINNNSTVSHDSNIGRGVHICPGVHMGGQVHIGDAAWIGIGSIILEKITIGSRSIIGAGSIVVENIPSGVVAYGNPSRVVRKVTEKDISRIIDTSGDEKN